MKIGILGGGQLARMLSLAAYPLGIHTLCFDPIAKVCAGDVTTLMQGGYDDLSLLKSFADQVDIITFETENIPLATAEYIKQYKPIYPGLEALKIGQDRLLEKNYFTQLDIPTPIFAAVDSFEDLQKAIEKIKYPAVLKTTRMGYDGKGQFVLKEANDLLRAWKLLNGQALILEQYISFDRELSLIAVRDKNGNIEFYPLIENSHQEGILRISKAPIIEATLQQKAQVYVQSILVDLNYIGVFVLELFQQGEHLLANEMAPRVHNSGHWTIEGAYTSQFANHLRAISGLPLGSTRAKGFSAMFNIIGSEPNITEILKISAANYHTYEKQPKPNRKLAHVTLNAVDLHIFATQFQQLMTLFNLK